MDQPIELKIHEDLCNEIHELYMNKNADYGDSFRKVREKIPNAILVRLNDKMNRLESLMNKSEDEQKVKNESIDDTLMDIANYALLELVERRKEHIGQTKIGMESGTFSDAVDSLRYAWGKFFLNFDEVDDDNPPLTWDDIEEMVGEPVWISDKKKWVIIKSLHWTNDSKWVEFDGNDGKFYFVFPAPLKEDVHLYRRKKDEDDD